MPDTDRPSQSPRTLVIVTGAGRSGTSSVAGALKQLGFQIPQPEVQANAANPRGHFEPRWVVNFHARLLAAADIFLMDGRPDAMDKAAEVCARPKFKKQLTTWLEEAFTQPRLVIKDPRAFWFHGLWEEAAASAGAELRFLTMLRHPAESVDSRLTHYMKDQDPARRAAQATTHVAGWTNVTLANERSSRDQQRVFVQYSELIQDWRRTMGAVGKTLGLEYDADLSTDEAHPIDDFIDPALHRVRATWDDLTVPARSRDQAEAVWQALADQDDLTVAEPERRSRLDQLLDDYTTAHAEAVALAADDIEGAIRTSRRETRVAVNAEHKKAQQEEQQRKAEERAAVESEAKVQAQRVAEAERTAPSPGVAGSLARAKKAAGRGRRIVRAVGARTRRKVAGFRGR